MMSRRAFLALALSAPTASALGRRPTGGTLRLAVPLSLGRIDPHASDDAASALLSPALVDSLYAWDASGRPYPTLAEALPDDTPGGARVVLRPGLVTARGRALDARDVVASLERARARAARPLLGAFGRPRLVKDEPLAILVPGASADALSDALASPLTAIVPRSFDATAPDGTGAFRADRVDGGLVLSRNLRAARGPALLDRIQVRGVEDLATALRAFESGDADLGWLGAGLHRRRANAVEFRTEPLGFVVLRSGEAAGSWGAPGVVERLASGIAPGRLSHLGLACHGSGPELRWGGPDADLLLEDGSPHFLEVARAVAGALSTPAHELRPLPLPQAELRRRTQSGRYALALGFVRSLGRSPRHTLLALLAAADPKLAERPPIKTTDPTGVTHTLPLAVLGELAVTGAHAADVHGLEPWDLGAVWRDPPT